MLTALTLLMAALPAPAMMDLLAMGLPAQVTFLFLMHDHSSNLCFSLSDRMNRKSFLFTYFKGLKVGIQCVKPKQNFVYYYLKYALSEVTRIICIAIQD